MENITFQVREITIRDNTGEGRTRQAVVALGRGLAAVQLERHWCIVHQMSGNIFTWVAFDYLVQAECYITKILPVLDWRISWEALLAFVNKPNCKYGQTSLEATRAAWAVGAA